MKLKDNKRKIKKSLQALIRGINRPQDQIKAKGCETTISDLTNSSSQISHP